jgi:hypothetical protein
VHRLREQGGLFGISQAVCFGMAIRRRMLTGFSLDVVRVHRDGGGFLRSDFEPSGRSRRMEGAVDFRREVNSRDSGRSRPVRRGSNLPIQIGA